MNNRYQINIPNVSIGIWKRIEVAFEKNLLQDEYVIKTNENAIIVDEDQLEKAKKIILSVDEKIIINTVEVKQKYRYLFYLENLDCANCAAKIERICKRNIIHESIVVDFATLKIVIETTKQYDRHQLKMQVQENAEMVDRHIEVKDKLKKKVNEEEVSFKIDKKKKNEFFIGISVFFFFFITKNVLKYGFNVESYWVLLLIYIGYVPSYFLLAKDILLAALNNLKNKRFFDENFLMALATVMALCCGLYDEALFVIIFYSIGEMCQQYAVNYSRKSIASLVNIRPDVAVIEIDGKRETIDPESVMIGDILCVNSGDKVALDGVVISGNATVDAQALSGESKSITVSNNDEILSGSIILEGSLKIKVTKTYENSMVSKILEMVDNASALKSKSENFISKFAKYYTPTIVILAIFIALLLPIFSDNYMLAWKGGWQDSIRVAMIFLVVSCPCALVISIPLGFFGGIGAASKQGILVKGSNYLETLNNVDIVVFDKTGTLTKGNFAVTKVVTYNEFNTDDLLRFAAFAEANSNHVIAQSIIKAYGKEIDASVVETKNIEDKRGVVSIVSGKEVVIGRKAFLDNYKIKNTQIVNNEDALIIAIDKVICGYIIIEDEIRSESKTVIKELKQLGIEKVYMVTGDSNRVAKATANFLGIDEFYSDMNPIDKVEALKQIKKDNPNKVVAFVGDGINDAPVISSADLGIAIGGLGNDATMQIADIVLVNQDLKKITKSVKIAKMTRKIVIENIVFALLVKFIFLAISPLNISSFFNMFLVYGAIFADVGVSLIAILNSLRATKVGKQ